MNFLPLTVSFLKPRLSARLLAALLFFLATPLFAQVPEVTNSLNANGKVGVAFTYRIQATNNPTKFTATGLPAGLTLNATTGLIGGKPTKSGTFPVTVTARNSKGKSKAVIVTMKIGSALQPMITSSLKASGTVGKAFSYLIKATNTPTSYRATGLPSGLKVNSKTGLISGTPKSDGNFSIKISATNPKGTGAETLQLVVASQSATKAKMITVQGGTLPQSSRLAGQTVATFEIGKYEVTLAEWKDVMKWAVSNGYDTQWQGNPGPTPVPSQKFADVGKGSSDDHPVRDVNWYDAVKWINAKSEKEGLRPYYQVNELVYRNGSFGPNGTGVVYGDTSANGYRLPSETEWEWAQMGGILSKGYKYSGSNDPNLVAWYNENSIGSPVSLDTQGRGTWPVGHKIPNELGIYDMNGNVWEWCDNLIEGEYRRINGGSWASWASGYGGGADSARQDIGFRLARSSNLQPAPSPKPAPSPQANLLLLVRGGSVRNVAVAKFRIAKYEVTWGDWQDVKNWALMNGYDDLVHVGFGSSINHPVIGVSWYDVVKWCNAKSEKNGLTPVYEFNGVIYRKGQSIPAINNRANGFRLPTVAEWEWAARGGVRSQGYSYSGSNDENEVGWNSKNSIGATVNLYRGAGAWPVGLRKANELGIHDMTGNVWEWCWDADSYGWNTFFRDGRRSRGGSWAISELRGISPWDQGFIFHPFNRFNDLGFRVVRNAP